MSSRRSQQTCHRLRALGLRQTEVYKLVTTIEKFISNNGEEWTVGRLKDLKTDYIRWRAGQPPAKTSSWIARHDDGVPKGIFGSLYRDCEGRELAKVLYALNLYSELTAKHVTPKQWQKFETSVKAEPVESFISMKDLAGFDKLPRRKAASVTISDVPWSDQHRAPCYDGKTRPEKSSLPYQVEWISRTELGLHFVETYHQVEDSLPGPILGEVWSKGIARRLVRDLIPGTVGKISLIQEAGYKLRAVANPNRVLQVALKPLGDQLYSYLRTREWDCTFNQEAGVKWVQDELKSGKEIHSIDLSDATNNFPLSVQLEILRGLNANEDDLKLFEEVSRSPWDCMGKTIQWTKGQPLGLYPSFAAFAISHGTMLQILGGDKSNFRVLGDDVVISDKDLAKRYRFVLQGMEVPVSESKTLVSTKVAEFAGSFITRESYIKPYKWRHVSDRSFMEHIRYIGPQFTGYLRPRQQSVARFLLDVPESLGGLGFNPKGLSLDDRLKDKMILIERLISDDARSVVHTTSEAVTNSIMRMIGDGYEYGSSRTRIPTRNPQGTPSKDIRQRLLTATGVQNEVFWQDESVPLGWVPEVNESRDPRGPTSLAVWEKLINRQKRVSTQPEVKVPRQSGR